MSRICKTCGVEKSFDGFYAQPRCRDGIRPRCKTCELVRQAAYAQRPEVKAHRNEMARTTRRPRIQGQSRDSLYGLRPGQFAEILAAQGGACASCGTTDPGGKGTWHVDHDHSCCPGKKACGRCIRGLLCALCNPMLGFAKDDVRRLEMGIAYLQRTRADV